MAAIPKKNAVKTQKKSSGVYSKWTLYHFASFTFSLFIFSTHNFFIIVTFTTTQTTK
jgi:hypothetical protein